MGRRKSHNDRISSPNLSNKNDSEWLYAISKNASMNLKKAGKWLVNLQEDSASAAWDKIKTGVAEGELWHSCMSRSDPEKPNKLLTIMVFTKKCTDLNDIIQVLDYLESSGIKPYDANIKYVKVKKTSSMEKWLYSSNLIRSVGSSIQHMYKFDLHKMELVSDSILCPTETLKSDFKELHATKNKYSKKKVDPKKEGKWMIVLPKDIVNTTWNKIKTAVTNGELWHCSVSTTDLKRLNQTYLLSIFTRDCTDLDDVIYVLDYLERCGIKPSNVNIKYTREDRPGPFMYTSDTVRRVVSTLKRDTYEFDIYKKELVSECKMYPTENPKISLWLTAKNNKYSSDKIDPAKMGKWMLFLPESRVNTAWDRIKEAVAKGELWFAKVCTDPERSSSRSCHIVFVFTKDFNDQSDVVSVHEYLTSSGIKPPNVIIKYKTVKHNYADRQSGVRQKLYMYTSETIQALGSTESSTNCTYKFDIFKNELVADCDLNPTQASEVSEWLFAENNMYNNEELDPKKMGKWMVFLPENKVNVAWKKIKEAVAKGQLWSAKVSTTPDNYSRVNYAVFIHTKDYKDINDVIGALAYLESSGIKPRKVNIKYKTELQRRANPFTRKGKPHPWMYYSNTIRNLVPAEPMHNYFICDTYEFDVDSNKLITDCKAYPAEISKIAPLLTAKNNKYKDEEINVEKVGKWMLFLPKTIINATWDLIKTAVALGELWWVKVATKPGTLFLRDFHAVHIYTKNHSDRKDVIRVLDYLEISKIKPKDAVFKYSPEQQSLLGVGKGGKKGSWMYSSDTIRSMGDVTDNS